MNSITDEPTFHIVFLGDEGVGKTAIINDLISSEDSGRNKDGISHAYKSKFEPTVGIQTYTKYYPHYHEDKVSKISIWDTSGKAFYEPLTSSLYLRADAVVIVFDVNDNRTFENATRKWLANFQLKMAGHFHRKASIMLVGNKIDSQMLHFTDDHELAGNALKNGVSHWVGLITE